MSAGWVGVSGELVFVVLFVLFVCVLDYYWWVVYICGEGLVLMFADVRSDVLGGSGGREVGR
jgi:hypothetical protein